MSSRFIFTNSPTRIPVEANKTTIPKTPDLIIKVRVLRIIAARSTC